MNATRPDDSFHPVADDARTTGVSLREWYAGQALPGVIAKGNYATPAEAADRCVCLADALIARLNVRPSASARGEEIIDLAIGGK